MSRFCTCVMADEFPVKLYVYDLSKGMARQLSLPFLGRQIEGIWHTAVVCYNTEFFFGGGGIDSCGPGGTVLGEPDKVIDLGKTQIPHDIFIDYLKELGSTSFRAVTYNLFEHNCNNFSNEVAQFLTGHSIPPQITSLPQDVLSTPFGAMIKPFVDSMQVHPSGGHQGAGAQQGQGGSHGQSSSRSKSPRDRSSNSVASPPTVHPSPNDHHPATPPIRYEDAGLVDREALVAGEASLLSTGEQKLLEEVLAYLAKAEKDISLSHFHLQVLDKLLSSGSADVTRQVQVLALLQQLVLHQAFVSMVTSEPQRTIVQVIQRSDRQPVEVRKSSMKMMVNLGSCVQGRKFLSGAGSAPGTASLRKLTKDICIACLLQQEDVELTECAAALIHNLSLGQIDDDTIVEFGSAVLEVLQRDISSKIGEHSLTALLNFMKTSPEVKSLTEIMGLAWSNIALLSPTADSLCKQIQACF